ncbi:MAG: SDR family NAD(P)-dependent oxidoreductase [Myxococcota bacterium]
MTSLRDYRGLTALVTGASSGIGRLLAARLAREGAHVILVARRMHELEQIEEEIRSAGGSAQTVGCDVSDRSAVDGCIRHLRQQSRGIDILVNNAGYGRHRPFLTWDVEDMERMFRVNFLGSLYFTKAVLPMMVERGRGWLVFMASVAGRMAPPDETAYAASKFAMVGLAEALSIEVEDLGVHVLTVCPGAIRTPFFDAEALERMPPIAKKSMVEPDGLVNAILRALARGQRELTYPRGIAAGYVSRAIAPGFTRRQMRRVTLDAVQKHLAQGRKKNAPGSTGEET